MIVDVFMFDDEFDMLDCRLYQLDGVVDKYIAIEADHTVSGIPKPYHLTENLNRYPDVPIEVVRVELGGVTPDSWKRDARQRDAASELIADLPGDALMIYGDLDEMPRPEILKIFDGWPSCLVMTHLIYSAALYHPIPWYGPVIGPRRLLGGNNATRVDRVSFRHIYNAGWHLSWFGTPEDRIRKMRHFAHRELQEPVGDRVGSEYPAQHKHVDGSNLLTWSGDVPRWIADGLAPLHWTTAW